MHAHVLGTRDGFYVPPGLCQGNTKVTLTRLAPTRGTDALSPWPKVLGMAWQSCQGLLYPGVGCLPRALLGAGGGEQECLCQGHPLECPATGTTILLGHHVLANEAVGWCG